MKKYTIELPDDIAEVYENIARVNKTPTEESLQIILKKVIKTLLGKK